MKEMIQNAVDAIRAVAGARPSVGLILGSGLGGLSDVLEDASFVEYASIPGLSRFHRAGARGTFCAGPSGRTRRRVHAGAFSFL